MRVTAKAVKELQRLHKDVSKKKPVSASLGLSEPYSIEPVTKSLALFARAALIILVEIKIKHWFGSKNMKLHQLLDSLYHDVHYGLDKLMETMQWDGNKGNIELYNVDTSTVFKTLVDISKNGGQTFSSISFCNMLLTLFTEVRKNFEGTNRTDLTSQIDDILGKINQCSYLIQIEISNPLNQKIVAKKRKANLKASATDFKYWLKDLTKAVSPALRKDFTITLSKKNNLATIVYEGVKAEGFYNMIEKLCNKRPLNATLEDIEDTFATIIIEPTLK